MGEVYAPLTARISRADGQARQLPRAEREILGFRFRSGDRELTVADLPRFPCVRPPQVHPPVLAWVIERAAGDRLHQLIARELWQPMGAEFDAEITVDAHSNPIADGGICATLRDLGRFGQLFLDRGQAGGRAVVPGAWIDHTIAGAPDGARAFADDSRPGYRPGAHYRNCWWVPDPGLPFFHGSGINGQHVYVHVSSQTVVAKLSTWPTALSPAAGLTIDAVTAMAGALQHGQL